MSDQESGNEELMLLTVGERLKEARKAKGLSLDDIAKSTRISLRHLNSLENNQFAQLPARTYTIGFARAYSKVVDLPEAEWLAALREELDSEQNKREKFELPDSDIEESGKVPGAKTAWIIAVSGLAIVAIIYAIWRGMSGGDTDLASTISSGDDAAEQANSDEGEAAAAADDVQDGGALGAGAVGPDAPVVFTATEDRIWVKFYDANGDQLMQKEMTLGETYTVPADAQGPQLATARPDALSITVGGKVIPALGTAERVIRDVPVDAVSLAARAQETE